MKTTIKTCTKCLAPYEFGRPHVCPDAKPAGPFTAFAQPQIGMVIDKRYRLQAKLGEGGMGSVFRARRMFIEDFVAIKFIRPDFLANAEIRQRFYQEAQVAARIKHPNVVSVYDFGETAEGLVYFVMEFLEGMSLGQRIAKHGPLTLDRVLELGTQICAALACMLANNVIHRDLKPDNIMLVKDEHGNEMVKVVDFGVAKILESNARLTRYQARIGSPVYSSPEQYLGKTVDHRTDLYSLGVIFYECLTGQVPFDSPNENELISAIVDKIPPRLDDILVGFPSGMADLVQQLLAKNPTQRSSSAAEVGKCLQRLRQDPQAQQVFRFNRKPEKRPAEVNAPFAGEFAALANLSSDEPPVADKAIASQNSPAASKSPVNYGELKQRAPSTNGAARLRAKRRKTYRVWQSALITAGFIIAASFLTWAILREPAAQAFAMQQMRHFLNLADRFVTEKELSTGSAPQPETERAAVNLVQRANAAPTNSVNAGAPASNAPAKSEQTTANNTTLAQRARPPAAANQLETLALSRPETARPATPRANGNAISESNARAKNLLASRQLFSNTPARPTANDLTKLAIPERMVLIQATAFRGEFPPNQNGAAGAPQVALGDFLIGKHEVTNREYLAFVEATGKHYPEWMDPKSKYHYLKGTDGFYKQLGRGLYDPNHPVVGVSWEDAVEYCNWLSQNSPLKYRLPTEEEWELAARGGRSERKYSWGDGVPQLANGGNIADESLKKVFPDWPVIWRDYDDRYAFTAPVGKFGANAAGVCDMTGNVWEWCSGWFAAANPQNQNGAAVPIGTERVIRGGSWSDTATKLQISNRRGIAPTFRSNNLGFRVAASWPQ